MEERCENIFEASKKCSSIAKILGGNFITVEKDKNEKYFAYTSLYDILRVLFGMTFGILLFREVARSTSEKDADRSIIFEIIISINSKMETIQPALVIITTYRFRFLYFSIKKDFMWIDEKVR